MKTTENIEALKGLDQFRGTQCYHAIHPMIKLIVATDGIAHLMKHGYHWLFGDLSVDLLYMYKGFLKRNVDLPEFLLCRLKLDEDGGATVTVREDIRCESLHTRHYDVVDMALFDAIDDDVFEWYCCYDGRYSVAMLKSEY